MQQTRTFLEILFGPEPTGMIEVRTFSAGEHSDPRTSFHDTVETATRTIAKAERDGRNVYVACATRCDNTSGKRENLHEARVVWADCDFKDEPRQVYEERIAEFPLQPTLVVESGGGFHVYWLLTEPLNLQSEDAKQELERTIDGVALALGSDRKVKDASRVLRAPGTTNQLNPKKRAAGREPEPCVIHKHEPAALYTLEDFAPFAEAGEASRAAAATDTSPLKPSLEILVRSDAAVRKRFGRDPEGLKDETPSGVDHSLACLLALRGISREEIREVVEASRTRAGITEQKPESYWSSTIRNALRFADRSAEDEDDRRTIIVSNRQLRDLVEECLAELQRANDPPVLFRHGTDLARIELDEESGRLRLRPLERDAMPGHLSRAANFGKIVGKPRVFVDTLPPGEVAKAIFAAPIQDVPFPFIEGVVATPTLRPDGQVLAEPGYDPVARLVYDPVSGFELPDIPSEPTGDDVKRAVDQIDEMIRDFPFVNPASRANTFAAIITPVVRPAIPGCVPAFLFDAPEAGTGKSLLAKILALIATGVLPQIQTAPADEDEWRKKITALLRTSPHIVVFDNLDRPLSSAQLAAALTTGEWADRVLGRSRTVELKHRATWVFTGNNIALGGDIPRRVVHVRMDAGVERPWERSQFRHPDLLGWVRENRGRLVGSILTIARAWHVAGRPGPDPEKTPRMGSFEEWWAIVGGMLRVAGVEGFLGNADEVFENVASEASETAAFLAALRAEFDSEAFTVKDIHDTIQRGGLVHDTLPGELDGGDPRLNQKLGFWFRKRKDSRAGGLHLVEAGKDSRTQRPRYRVDVVDGAAKDRAEALRTERAGPAEAVL